MPARKFRADLAAAAADAAKGKFDRVISVEKGDDAELIVTYVHEDIDEPLQVRLLATNVDEYPEPCGLLLFTDNQHVSKPMLNAMEEVQVYAGTSSTTILEVITLLTRSLTKAVGAHRGRGRREDSEDHEMTDVEVIDDDDDDDDDMGYDDYDCDDDDDDEPDRDEEDERFFALMNGQSAAGVFSGRGFVRTEAQKKIQQRIRQSVQKVKDAGYRFGVLSGMIPEARTSIMSVSIRIHKLGLPEEALQVWDLAQTDYLVLLIHSSGEYPFLKTVRTRPAGLAELKFRIAKCANYKPTLAQALAAFGIENNMFTAEPEEEDANDAASKAPPLKPIFISNSLDHFMTQCFASLVKMRVNSGLSWDEANDQLLVKMGTDLLSAEEVLVTGSTVKGKEKSRDHLAEDEDASVPLVAMQFAHRYLVDCTKYCLRCHRRIKRGFGSLKPFVCSNPLCLFQYMQMGLGPSVEHEIMSQPLVVDLLVSFCYASTVPPPNRYPAPAAHGAAHQPADPTFPIREFPCGLRLMLPDLFVHEDPNNYLSLKPPVPKSFFKAHVDAQRMTLAISAVQGSEALRDPVGILKPGKWFILVPTSHFAPPGTVEPGQQLPPQPQPAYPGYGSGWSQPVSSASPATPATHGIMFGVVTDADFGPQRVGISLVGNVGQLSSAIFNSALADMYIGFFDVDFDSLGDRGKANAIRFVLDMLPPISTIKSYLERNPNSQIRTMPTLPPVSAILLEWIVASNRSLILQMEGDELTVPMPAQFAAAAGQPIGAPPVAASSSSATPSSKPSPAMIPGMAGWTQFRFAQGAPDKEQRFAAALEAESGLSMHYPTIFAWHGSTLSNWHSIIRTGLDFKQIAHGRAFGNGIYFSQEINVSQGYVMGAGLTWPSSELRVSSAIALNEIINAPDKFLSRSPHLVVQHIDWVQCRYLFVQRSHTAYTNPAHPSAVGPAPPPLFPGGAHRIPPLHLANTMANTNPPPPSPATPNSTQHHARSIEYIRQDPTMSVYGPGHKVLEIPVTAIPTSRFRVQGIYERGETRGGDELELESDDDDKVDRDFFSAGDGDPTEEDDDDVDGSGDDSSVIEIPDPYSSKAKSKEEKSATPVPAPPTPRPANLLDFEPGTLDVASLPRMQPPQRAGAAGKHIAKEIANLRAIQESTPLHELGWYVADLDNITNMFQLVVELHSFERSMPLAVDMAAAGVSSIVLEVLFGEEYPYSPPFVRVIRPRFLPFMNGGGGHVTAGGAMCMELLTSTGWSPACSIESVLVQVRLAICSTEPAPARLENAGGWGGGLGTRPGPLASSRAAAAGFAPARMPVRDYGMAEAVAAFIRAARTHGWAIPPGLSSITGVAAN